MLYRVHLAGHIQHFSDISWLPEISIIFRPLFYRYCSIHLWNELCHYISYHTVSNTDISTYTNVKQNMIRHMNDSLYKCKTYLTSFYKWKFVLSEIKVWHTLLTKVQNDFCNKNADIKFSILLEICIRINVRLYISDNSIGGVMLACSSRVR
jgi:hypothetical protein